MAKGLVLTGTPNPRQVEFFESRARHTAYGGARGGGKSWAMRRKFVLLALNYPNLKLLLLRRTFPELEVNHIVPLKQELYGATKYREKDHTFTFPTGSTIRCGYCDREDDVYQYQGHEYDVIGMEEATNFTETQMLFLTTCNRTTRTDFTPRMYYTCNPGGVGHGWVKRLFVDREYRNAERAEDYCFIPARVYDNSALMEADPEYLRVLQNLPEEKRRAYLDGDWDALEGQFFSEFRRDKHVCEPFEIPADWRRFRAMDWGYNDPCCVLWFAVAPDRHIYVYDEYYEHMRLASEVAETIKLKTGETKIAYTAASPDMWQKRGLQIKAAGGFIGECTAEVFQRAWVPLIRADNDRKIGWQRVRENLRDAPDGTPYLQIFSTCRNLIKELPLMQYDDHDHEDARDGDDHAPEALRYGLMSRPSPIILKNPENKRRDPADPFYEPEPRKHNFLAV